jgi:hypothetical protein
MRAVREAILSSPIGLTYQQIAAKAANKQNKKPKSSTTPKKTNIMGTAMSLLLSDLEHSALMALKECLEQTLGRKVGVLIFDGCMSPQHHTTSCNAEVAGADPTDITADTM